MKAKGLLLVFVLIFSDILLSQEVSNIIYEINIEGVLPSREVNRIQLQKEGLLLWSTNFKKGKYITTHVFIPIDKVGKHLESVSLELNFLFNFIKEAGIMEMSDVLCEYIDISKITDEDIREWAIYLNEISKEGRGYLSIYIRDLSEETYHHIIYQSSDSRIKELIIKLNNLIPPRIFNKFHINPF